MSELQDRASRTYWTERPGAQVLRNPFLGTLWALGITSAVAAILAVIAFVYTVYEQGMTISLPPGASYTPPSTTVPLVIMLFTLGATAVFLTGAFVLHGIRWYQRHPPQS